MNGCVAKSCSEEILAALRDDHEAPIVHEEGPCLYRAWSEKIGYYLLKKMWKLKMGDKALSKSDVESLGELGRVPRAEKVLKGSG